MDRIDAYLLRIAYDGPRQPTLGVLTDLVSCHLTEVPFETLSLHSGETVELDMDWLLDKLVARRRGGFCYELGGCFAWLLRELGFEVSLLAARVYGEGDVLGIPFDHLALEVELDETYLVDVGFGESPAVPLDMESADVQPDGWKAYRIERDGDDRVLAAREDGGWRRKYRFDRVRRELTDFDPGCTFHQSSESPFARGPVVSRIVGDERVTLRRDRLIHTARDGDRREQTVDGPCDFAQHLRREFGIELPAVGLRAPRVAGSASPSD